MAAGLGFKTFTTGEVLTAADTNGYLMQGVLVFASSAARAAAITSPQEGQYSYLKDTNSTEYYDGAAWIAAPIGDITGVTAGTGISGGGTSGTVTITNSMATEIAAKGDLIVGTGAATFDNLTVGTNNQILVADSTASTGLKWATPAGAASLNYTLLNAGGTALTGATAITISGITSKALNIYVSQGGSVNASTEITLKPNNENNASLIYYQLSGVTPVAPGETNIIYLAQTGNNSLNEMIAQCNITSCDSAGRKPVISFGAGQGTSNVSYQINGTYNGSAITSIVLNSSSGNFDEGTIYVYGGS